MALWMNRAGAQGQYLSKFLEDSRIYLTWTGLNHDLSQIASKDELRTLLSNVYPNTGAVKLANHTGQLWRFAHEMQISDWVIVPDMSRVTKSGRGVSVGLLLKGAIRGTSFCFLC